MVKLGVEKINFKILYCRTIYNFPFKTSVFCGAGCVFWELFSQFFVIFSFKISVFWGAGRYFWVKKYIFFWQKFGFCGAGWSFWYHFCQICVLLFKFNRIIFKNKGIYLSILNLGFCSGLNPFEDSFVYHFVIKKELFLVEIFYSDKFKVYIFCQ